MKNRICFISRNYNDLNSAGTKARTDVERILLKNDALNLGLKRSYYSSVILGFFLNLAGIIKTIFSLKRGDYLVLQYPVKKYYKFLCIVAHLRKAIVITLIHDLGSFRRKKLSIGQEIEKLSYSDYTIATNENMKSWLEFQGYNRPMNALKIWDYLTPGVVSSNTAKTEKKSDYTIIYAGSLSERKNRFFKEFFNLVNTYSVKIYGNSEDFQNLNKNSLIHFEGFIPPEEFISKINGDFGLVWDGDSVDDCTGDWGEYLAYNTPHKSSLYIRGFLPLIVWDKSAMADFVKDKNIGLCIASLRELENILANLTEEEYLVMKKNVMSLSEELNSGYYFNKALAEALT